MSNEELALLIQQGQQQYIPELYSQVEKFIRMKANSFYRSSTIKCSRCGVELDDLIQEGYFAMLDAVKGYKQESGYKFLTYIDYPFLNRYNTLIGNRTGRTKNEPLNNANSLDEPMSTDDEAFTLADTLTDKNSETPFEKVIEKDYHSALHDALEKGMEQLIPEQRTAIQCRFYEKRTLNDTGNKIGCTREQARQYEAKALRAFRKPKIARTLMPFLYDGMESYSLRGTGIQTFKNTGASSTERAAEHEDKSAVEDTIKQQLKHPETATITHDTSLLTVNNAIFTDRGSASYTNAKGKSVKEDFTVSVIATDKVYYSLYIKLGETVFEDSLKGVNSLGIATAYGKQLFNVPDGNFIFKDADGTIILITDEERQKMSMAEYSKIKTGMTYTQVTEIVGSYGEEQARTNVADYETVILSWTGTGAIGSNANVTFQNGKVVAKAQVGLQ